MKKFLLFAFTVVICTSFTACSSVSQKEYKELQEKLSEANERIEAFAAMEQKYAGLSASEVDEQKAANELKAEQNRKEKEKILADEKAQVEKDEVEASKGKVDKNASMISSSGVFIRNIEFFPNRNIVTVNIENTTEVAKKGYIKVSCLDKDGLQLKELSISFTIPAKSTDTVQNNTQIYGTPEETVLVKATSILAVNN